MELRKEWRGKNWIAEFGYHTVMAPTKPEARELAYRTMEEMVSGEYTPRLLIYGNLTGVAWRTPSGYAYSIARDDSDGRVQLGGSCHTSVMSGDEIERQVRSHMAQNATVTGSEFTDHSAFILNDEDRGDYLRWLAWQRAVRAAMEAGHDMETARDIADRQRYAA